MEDSVTDSGSDFDREKGRITHSSRRSSVCFCRIIAISVERDMEAMMIKEGFSLGRVRNGNTEFLKAGMAFY